MSEARRAAGGWEIRARAPLDAEAVARAIARHRVLDARGRSGCEKWGPDSSVSRVELDSLAVAVKWCRDRGLRGRLSDALRGSRAERESRGARLLAALGVPAAEPLAVAERWERGLVRESFLLTRFVEGSVPLAVALPALGGRARRETLATLGRQLARLHRAGCHHRDLKPSNLLRAPDGSVVVLDAGDLRRLTPRRQLRALAALDGWARRLGLSRSDRARGFAAYRAALGAAVCPSPGEILAEASARPLRVSPGALHYPLAPRSARERLRIALVHPHAAPLGGVERNVWELAHRLVAAGHEVHWFCRRADASLDPRVALHRVPDPARGLPWLRLLLFDSLSRREVRREVRRAGAFDVVHGFGKTSHPDLHRDGSGCLADFQRYSIDSLPSGRARALGRLAPRQRVESAIERRRYGAGGARRVVAISRRVREQILARHAIAPEAVDVIHPGVDCERFRPDPERRAAVRRELGLDEEVFALVFVGSDYRRKGLSAALEVLRELPAAHLWVLGGDRRAADWRRLAARLGVASRVAWLGLRPDPERHLAAADVLLFPSRFDAFGNAVLEAMAAGLPVVVSRRAGAAEVVDDGKTGACVADPEDPEALAAAVRGFLDPDVRAEAGRLARQAALGHGAEAHFRRWLDLYRELAGAAAPGAG